MNDKLKTELESFQGIWHGGFWNDIANTDNRQLGRVYDYCLKNRVDDSNVLEIGCGRGSWTKNMLGAKSIHVVDALSAEHNGFWENVGRHPHINYQQVKDFELSSVPDNSIDFVWSYDVFCHISWSGTCEYIKALKNKMKAGAIGFIMVADYDKYIASGSVPGANPMYKSMAEEVNDFDGPAYAGRWYWYSKDRFCQALTENGFKVIEADVKLDARNPITQFSKS